MQVNTLLLDALRAALNHERVQWKEEIPVEIWSELFRTAERHRVLPMIFEAVYSCEAARALSSQLLHPFRQRTMQLVMLQTVKSSEFLTLYQQLREKGITPIVVKGAVCRSLFPNPDYRLSGDEDILISGEQFLAFNQLMLDYGMEYADSQMNGEEAYEVPYGKKGSPLYIEAHKQLFSPQSAAYGNLNAYFDGAEERTISVEIDGVPVRTLGCTDHLFYLILHAFKHFLHSGFGIRQVCDIVMMANAWGNRVDWQWMLSKLREVHADLFAAAIFRIGEKYLVFDGEKAHYPIEWAEIQVDESLLLADMLSGGVYGATDNERLHSSTVTLNAVIADRQGKKARVNVLKSLFPTVKELSGRYPYLSKKPYLLPVAWMQRLLKYKQELNSGKRGSATESIKIGEQRVEMFRQYGIIE